MTKWVKYNKQIGKFLGIYELCGVIIEEIVISKLNCYDVVQTFDDNNNCCHEPDYILINVPDYPKDFLDKVKVKKEEVKLSTIKRLRQEIKNINRQIKGLNKE